MAGHAALSRQAQSRLSGLKPRRRARHARCDATARLRIDHGLRLPRPMLPHDRSVTDHPGSRSLECLAAIGRTPRLAGTGPRRATSAVHPVTRPGTARRIGALLVHGMRAPHGLRQGGQRWRAAYHPCSELPAFRTCGGRPEFRQRLERIKRSASLATILIKWHDDLDSKIVRHRHIDIPLDMLDRAVGARLNIKIENLCGQPQRGAGIGDIDHPTDMALHRRCP